MGKKVSIIITTFGVPDKLGRAIKSLQNQSYSNIEIIVVDDNSNDDANRVLTKELMNHFTDDRRIKYICHSVNKNGAAARNTGIREAGGEFIAFLDSDDFYLHDRIEQSVIFLSNNESYDGVCVDVLVFTNGVPKCIVRVRKEKDYRRELFYDFEMLGTGSNLFFRKSAVDETGFFDESFDRFQDVEYMIRFANKHAIGILDDVLIVKENTGLHMIEYSKLRNATYNFVGKFNEYINSFSKDEQNNFFVKRFTKLLYSAFANGSIADIQEATAALMNYRALTTKENKTIMNIEKYRERRSIKERLLLLGNQLGLLKKLKRKQSKLVFSQLSDDKIRSIYKML